MGIVSQPPSPIQKAPAESRLKLHLRLITAGGYTYHVVALRPGTRIAFSTNFFHETWHIVTRQRRCEGPGPITLDPWLREARFCSSTATTFKLYFPEVQE